MDRLVVGWPDEVADEIGLGPDDAVAVLTHDVKFDEPAIVEALRRGCRYVGAVGSRKTQGDRRARLREAGVTDAELDRLRGPVGLDLGGRNPSETALAIMAEVVAERYGGSGTPLRRRGWARGGGRRPVAPDERRRGRRSPPAPATRFGRRQAARARSRAGRSSQHVVDAARAAGLDADRRRRPADAASSTASTSAPARGSTNPRPRGGPVELGPARAARRSTATPDGRRGRHPARRPAARPGRRSIRALVAAATRRPATPFVVPRYADDGAPEPDPRPALDLARSPTSWRATAASARSSRRTPSSCGVRSTARTRTSTPPRTWPPRRQARVPTYREAMTTATAAELEAAWAERVRANRDQVERVREVPDRDFYAPVSSLFVADPRRTGEEALDALLALAEPGDRWLDIGAGAGRYALPLALASREVIAVEPSASMRNALRTGKEEHGLDEPPDRRGRVAGVARASSASRRSRTSR